MLFTEDASLVGVLSSPATDAVPGEWAAGGSMPPHEEFIQAWQHALERDDAWPWYIAVSTVAITAKLSAKGPRRG